MHVMLHSAMPAGITRRCRRNSRSRHPQKAAPSPSKRCMQRPATTELHPTLRSTIVPRPWVRGGAEEQPTDHTCLLAAACSPLHGYDTGRTAHGGTGTGRQSTTRTVRYVARARLGRQLLATEGRFWCCVGAARSEERLRVGHKCPQSLGCKAARPHTELCAHLPPLGFRHDAAQRAQWQVEARVTAAEHGMTTDERHCRVS